MIKFLVLLLSMFATVSQADTFEVDSKRLIPIVGVIAGNGLDIAQSIDKMADGSGKPIYLLITSPGGSVQTGAQILSAMTAAKERGHELVCVVPLYAASMGFQVLINCDRRYTLKNTLLLFHAMAISGGGRLTQEDVLYIAGRLRAWEAPFIRDLLDTLKISVKVFKYHYRRETMWFAYEFSTLSPDFITIVDDIQGAGPLFRLE
jgi:hypothetical protein